MVQVLLSPQSCELVRFSSTLLLKFPCSAYCVNVFRLLWIEFLFYEVNV
ncbi:hypothetical protein HanPSC8_Chr07g0288261 [Helianthus annuus]|nr:hypothetical protein HanPSC8_Chr07g0288261 [Helianthus annuus]